MKSKGFGLISLLAVVVIIMVIIVLSKQFTILPSDTIVKDITINGRTITVTKLDGETYTLTTQDTDTTYSKVSQFTNDSGYITDSHNFASGVKVNDYTITVG